MIAAGAAAEDGHVVTLFEKNEKLGKKLYLTGKGRCNLTNAAQAEQFFAHIPHNPKFLFSALNAFSNDDIVELIHRMGVPTKVERGGRVFPQSDKSSDILRALERYVRGCGVQVRLNTPVEGICVRDGRAAGVSVAGECQPFDAVILATGGVSYPSTGSTGDGYRFLRTLGHTIVEPKASLVPLETQENWPKTLMGLTLKNVELSALRGKKRVFCERGEMLFAHFGVTGPLVLSASAVVADAPEGVRLHIDLKPALSIEQVRARVLSDLQADPRKQMTNVLRGLMPMRLIPVVLELSGIKAETPAGELSKERRLALCETLKCIPLTVARARPIAEAIVTRGGVNVREVDASTMQSKHVPGLFIAGELLDVDGYTGGFNLQIAYSTGYLAGKSVNLCMGRT